VPSAASENILNEEYTIEYIDNVVISDEEAIQIEKNTKLYSDLENQLRELIQGESDPIANAANMAALLFNALPDVNWAGFYFLKGQELVLGPFQGKPACVRIPLGKGVCGTAARMRETLLVPDVHKFPCHIACDPESNSEIVVPLIKNGELLGVLDIDSQRFDRFDTLDREWIEKLVEVFALQM
jgi:L-methionine (R)-S-oxide reductase